MIIGPILGGQNRPYTLNVVYLVLSWNVVAIYIFSDVIVMQNNVQSLIFSRLQAGASGPRILMGWVELSSVTEQLSVTELPSVTLPLNGTAGRTRTDDPRRGLATEMAMAIGPRRLTGSFVNSHQTYISPSSVSFDEKIERHHGAIDN